MCFGDQVNSVAIVEDTGGFSGIIVAAHELGHLYVPLKVFSYNPSLLLPDLGLYTTDLPRPPTSVVLGR